MTKPMAIPHPQLGLAWAQPQGIAHHKVTLKQNTIPSFLTRCSCKHFVLPLEMTYLKGSRILQAVYRLVLFSSFQKLGRVAALGATDTLDWKGSEK